MFIWIFSPTLFSVRSGRGDNGTQRYQEFYGCGFYNGSGVQTTDKFTVLIQ